MGIRIGLFFVQVTLWLTIHLLTRSQGEWILPGLRLGREATDADMGRVRRIRIVNHAGLVLSALVIWGVGLEPGLVFALVLIPLLVSVVMGVEMNRLVASAAVPPLSTRYAVVLDPPTLRQLVSVPMQVATWSLVLVSTGVVGLLMSALPEKVPVHFNLSGQPDRYASPMEHWIMLPILGVTLAVTSLVCWMISKERWTVSPEARERSMALQVERRQLLISLIEKVQLGVVFSMTLIWVGIVYASLPGREGFMSVVIAVGLGFSGLTTIWPLLGMGRLMELQEELQKLGVPAAHGTRESGWKRGGMYYYSPEDPAVFVPKRHGIGSTLNWARPQAWAFLAGLILVPIAIVVGVAAWIRV